MGYIGNANKDSVEYIFDVPQVRIVFSHFENFSLHRTHNTLGSEFGRLRSLYRYFEFDGRSMENSMQLECGCSLLKCFEIRWPRNRTL